MISLLTLIGVLAIHCLALSFKLLSKKQLIICLALSLILYIVTIS
jgi:hypothetical protein